MTAWSEKYPKLYAAAKTALVVFVATYVPTVLGWIGDVIKWAKSDGEAFPSVDSLGKLAIAAFFTALSAALSLLLNWGQEHGLPGRPARYPTENGEQPLAPPVVADDA